MKVCALTSWVGTIVTTIGLYACGGASSEGSAPATPEAAAPAPASEPTETAPAPSAAAPESPAASGTESAAAEPGGEPDTRTMESIAQVVKAHRKEARDCYEKGLKQIPGLKGDVVIHFVLKPSGEVKQAELNEQRSTIRE